MSLLRLLGLAAVGLGFAACASAQTGPLYAEYALDPAKHPESIACFYECLKSGRPDLRDLCFGLCDGVVAMTTDTPCDPGSPVLCRGYRVPVPEPSDDESDGDLAGDIFLGLLNLAFDAATDDSDDDSDDGGGEHPATHSRSHRKSSSSTGTEWGSKSTARDVTSGKSISKSSKR